jgi:hypothetical protein
MIWNDSSISVIKNLDTENSAKTCIRKRWKEVFTVNAERMEPNNTDQCGLKGIHGVKRRTMLWGRTNEQN